MKFEWLWDLTKELSTIQGLQSFGKSKHMHMHITLQYNFRHNCNDGHVYISYFTLVVEDIHIMTNKSR